MKINRRLRNIYGAFFGGFVGILFAHYLAEELIIVGCFVGAFLGYWSDKFLRDYKKDISRSIDRLRTRNNKIVAVLKLKESKTWKHLIMLRDKVGRWSNMPLALADTITIFVGIAAAVLIARIDFVRTIIADGFSLNHAGHFSAFKTSNAIILVMVAPIVQITQLLVRDKAVYIHQIRRYRRYGPFLWTLFQIKNLIMFSVFTALALTVTLSIGLIVLLVICFVAFTAISIVVLFRTFWKYTKSRNYWFCFGVTSVISLSVWLLMGQFLKNQVVFWAVALLNGVLSAWLTDFLRRSYRSWVIHTAALYEITHDEFNQAYKNTYEACMMPLSEWGDTTGQKMVQLIRRVKFDVNSFWSLI